MHETLKIMFSPLMSPFLKSCQVIFLASLLASVGCQPINQSRSLKQVQPTQFRDVSTSDLLQDPVTVQGQLSPALVTQSWQTYRQRFIQVDGRVIDREAQDRSTSEGQAYAMLRAVLIDDAETFANVLQRAELNLIRKASDETVKDTLWAWKWGQRPDQSWGVIDENFASDADIDAITALILAARRWNRPDYLALAKTKLADLWALSTIEGASLDGRADPTRYLLPGPLAPFAVGASRVYLNPSYLAPYAFRLFAQVDPERDWMTLVNSSYAVLTEMGQLSPSQLPVDWLLLNHQTGQLELIETGSLLSVYSFDAYRVWWRLRLDALWFNEPRATTYLQTHSKFLVETWQSQGFISARISPAGEALAPYESTSQYAMLYVGLLNVNETVASQILSEKLTPSYQDGFWDNNSAYYVQNLGWFAIYPFDQVLPQWLTAKLPSLPLWATSGLWAISD